MIEHKNIKVFTDNIDQYNKIKNIDYIYGILVTDGNLNIQDRNRGKIKLEVKYEDKDIVYKLQSIVSGSKISERIRDTNYAKNYHSITFINYKQEFRELMINMGFPIKNKSLNECPPNTIYNKKDFWRGVIDGDGSIGYTRDNRPFVSLTTISEVLNQEFIKFLKEEFNIKKVINRNKRDNCYNICLYDEDAINFGNYIYDSAEIYLDRKYRKYKEISNWQRNKNKVHKVSWTPEEDKFVLENKVEISMQTLGRSESSIKMRIYRLNKNQNNKASE